MPLMVSRALSMAQDDVRSASMVVTIMDKEGARTGVASLKKANLSKQSTKSRPKEHEKCLAQAGRR